MYGPFMTRSRNIDSAWRSMVGTISEKGSMVYTEGKRQKTLECICGIAHLTDWRTGAITPRNYIGLSPDVIEHQYWPQYSSSEKGEHTYTYGWCMKKRFGFNQIQHVVDSLKRSGNVAFAQLWNPIEDSRSPNPPCIDIVAFQKVNEKINIIDYIRSNDIARAWSEDVSGSYAVFLTEVAAHYGGSSARGDVLTVSGSAHLYHTSLDEIKERFKSSYSSSNQKPAENASTIFGPVLRGITDKERCSVAVQRVVEDYSRSLDKVALHVCLKSQPTKAQRATGLRTRVALDHGRLGGALMQFEGKNDEGELETMNQIAWAASKLRATPESRRIVMTPNNPSQNEYSINPIVIQFLAREGILHTIALYHDVAVDSVDEHYQLLKTISEEVREESRNLKQGPLIMLLSPVRF
ncbi:MAG: thymidylate synthase [Promethearchaeati archaeon SRVP18_Atabeyarchaeia-1]